MSDRAGSCPPGTLVRAPGAPDGGCPRFVRTAIGGGDERGAWLTLVVIEHGHGRGTASVVYTPTEVLESRVLLWRP